MRLLMQAVLVPVILAMAIPALAARVVTPSLPPGGAPQECYVTNATDKPLTVIVRILNSDGTRTLIQRLNDDVRALQIVLELPPRGTQAVEVATRKVTSMTVAQVIVDERWKVRVSYCRPSVDRTDAICVEGR